MRISPKMKKALNDQIAMEYAASSTYLSMAGWCEVTGYHGGASYFYAQSAEERNHMLKFVKYLSDVGEAAIIPAVKAPASTYKSLEELLKTALKNEQSVTKAIHKIVDLAHTEKDHCSYAFLEWFVNEQIQEEAKFEDLLQKFDLIGRDKLAINEIDKILAAQTAAPDPAA